MPIDPEEFKTRDAASYDAVADRFDYWTERVTATLAQRVVELALLSPGEHVLDVGTGSGVVAFAAAPRVAPTGRIVGIDLSEGMLEASRAKAGFREDLQFHRMDAEHLQFKPATFDAVLSLFALLHFPDPGQAIAEMARVVKPAGRVVIGIGSGRAFSWATVKRLFENRGALVAPGALDQFLASRLPHASEHESVRTGKPAPLRQLLEKAGLREVRSHSLHCTHRIETPADFWDLQITFSSTMRKRLEAAAPESVRKLRAEFLGKCATAIEKGGSLIYRNGATIYSAVRP